MDAALIRAACTILHAGGVVAYPTDTFYGLAADPRSAEAVSRLFAIKGRQAGQAIPLIAADEAQAAAAGEMTATARRLVANFWPGPLSLVMTASDLITAGARAADGSVALRVPDRADARELARAFGFCLTATSANRSGEPPATSATEVAATLGRVVGMVLDGGETPGGAPSTIADARDTPPRLVRAGAIAWERVLRSLQ